jgi:hypothetical protein
MERGVWKSPVVIEMCGRPGSVAITGTLDAALMLLGAWPTKRTNVHLAAVLSCRDVMVGKAEAGLARADFIDAAIEAGYRIRPETFLSELWDPLRAQEDLPRPPVGLADLIRKHRLSAAAGAAAQEAEVSSIAHAFSPAAQPAPSGIVRPSASPRPHLRELLARLVHLLGLIGMELARSFTRHLGIGTVRRADRQTS